MPGAAREGLGGVARVVRDPRVCLRVEELPHHALPRPVARPGELRRNVQRRVALLVRLPHVC